MGCVGSRSSSSGRGPHTSCAGPGSSAASSLGRLVVSRPSQGVADWSPELPGARHGHASRVAWVTCNNYPARSQSYSRRHPVLDRSFPGLRRDSAASRAATPKVGPLYDSARGAMCRRSYTPRAASMPARQEVAALGTRGAAQFVCYSAMSHTAGSHRMVLSPESRVGAHPNGQARAVRECGTSGGFTVLFRGGEPLACKRGTLGRGPQRTLAGRPGTPPAKSCPPAGPSRGPRYGDLRANRRLRTVTR